MNDYFDKSVSFGNLYSGLKKSCRNVRWKDSVIGYENKSLLNTYRLRRNLVNKTYRISRYQVFKIYEPKERIIVASRIVDRQFQRSLCDSGLYKDITEHFIRDNVSCQLNKGTDDAINRLKIHMRRYYNKHGNSGWVLKCDIHHFFPETSHEVAKQAVQKYVSDRRACETVCTVIDSFEGDRGIGLGSQISQLVELLVLNDLDHFIKEKLHIKYYIRYMDDFVLIHEDKTYLQYCRKAIQEKLSELDLRLNKKTSIYPLEQGIKFLHWRFIFSDSGKVLLFMEHSKLTKQKRRMRKLWSIEQEGIVEPGSTRMSLQCWLSNANRGNTYKERSEMISFYHTLTGEEY